MKKLLLPFAVLVLTTAPGPVTASSDAVVGPKIRVCHVVDAGNGELVGFATSFGRSIEVSAEALEAHLGHGDSSDFTVMDAELRSWVEEFFGISLGNANCYMHCA